MLATGPDSQEEVRKCHEASLGKVARVGWRADHREEHEPSRHLIEYGVKHHHAPMLLIDIIIEKPVVS